MRKSEHQLVGWQREEWERIRTLQGEPRLAAMWCVISRLAAESDIDGKIAWLKRLMSAAWKEGRYDHKLRAFGELRRIYETDPRYAHLRSDILWYFKWILEDITGHVDVSRDTIERVFDEMTQFYRASRESLRPIYGLRCEAAIHTGHTDAATEWYDKWKAEPRGKSDDCAACDAGREIVYLLSRKKIAEAMEVAKPIFLRKLWCNDAPSTVTRMIGPCLGKNPPLALALLKSISRPVRRTPSMLSSLATHSVCWMMLANPVRARRLALLTLRRALDSHNDLHRFHAYRSCGLWAATTVIARRDSPSVPRRLLPGFDSNDEGQASLADVAGVCFEKAKGIAAQFDTRNGTERFTTQINEIENVIRKAAGRMNSDRR